MPGQQVYIKSVLIHQVPYLHCWGMFLLYLFELQNYSHLMSTPIFQILRSKIFKSSLTLFLFHTLQSVTHFCLFGLLSLPWFEATVFFLLDYCRKFLPHVPCLPFLNRLILLKGKANLVIPLLSTLQYGAPYFT